MSTILLVVDQLFLLWGLITTAVVEVPGMIDAQALVKARESKGFSQPDLARRAGCSQQLINALEKGTTRSTKFLPKIAQALDVPPGTLDTDWSGIPAPEPEQPATISQPLIRDPRPDFRVFASAEGGAGEIIRSPEPIDFVPRPTHLVHVRDAYGLLITGTSMEPEYNAGEMAIVEPSMPVIAGEVYIFYAEKHGEARATIKKLRRAAPEKWLVTQHNPPDGAGRDFQLPRKDWTIAHRVTGKFTRR